MNWPSMLADTRFTGKERDTESGNDYFGARYYGSSMGRFTSPDDDSGENALSPQSWNLYSYVENNPLTNTDPDGHDCIQTSNSTSQSVTVTVTTGKCGSGGGTYVDGTVDTSSLTYNGKTGDLGYSFSNYADGSGSSGAGVLAQAQPYDHPGIDGPANAAIFGQIGNEGMGAIKLFGERAAIQLGLGLGGAAAEYGYGAWKASRFLKAANEAKANEIAENVAKHAYDKHVVKKGEFGDISPDEFKGRVKDTVLNPSDERSLSNGRTAYWSDSEQMVVIENSTSPSQSTAFRPTGGKAYFDNLR